MVVRETRELNGRMFDYTYSDRGMMIERNGARYSEAYDLQGSGREYIETDIPIEIPEEAEPENLDAQYAEAGRILMGVSE